MRRFLAAFFRHPFTLILPAILIPLVVVFVVKSFANTYTSQATIFITSNPYVAIPNSNPYSSDADNLANDIQEFLVRPSFVVSVANQTDMPKTYPKGTANVNDLMVTRITGGLTITAVGNETLNIQYSDPDPHVAAQVITALLQQYLTQSIQDSQNNASTTTAYYKQKLQLDEQQLASDDQAVKAYTQAHPNVDPTTDPNLAVLESNYNQDLNQVQTDQSTLQKINSTSGAFANLFTFEVTDPPTIPTTPTVKSKTTLIAMIGGVALGLGVSLGLVGLLAVADRRIHSRDDLSEAFPVPVLEVLPRLRGLQEQAMMVGSEESLAQLSQVPVLATLPSFAESTSTQSVSRSLTTSAEDE
jgi:uncharacterized protein involved in exopolysaccharide biosynthesis